MVLFQRLKSNSFTLYFCAEPLGAKTSCCWSSSSVLLVHLMWLVGGLSLGKISSKPLLLNKWRKLLPPTPPLIFPSWPSLPPPPSASFLSSCQDILSSYATSEHRAQKKEKREETMAVLAFSASPQFLGFYQWRWSSEKHINLDANKKLGSVVRHIVDMRWGRIALVWQESTGFHWIGFSAELKWWKKTVNDTISDRKECSGKPTTDIRR